MRIFKLPGLVFIFGGLFLGLIRLINGATGQAQDSTLRGILLNLDPNGGGVVRNSLPSGLPQEMYDGLLQLPAWAASLGLGLILYLMARQFGDDD